MRPLSAAVVVILAVILNAQGIIVDAAEQQPTSVVLAIGRLVRCADAGGSANLQQLASSTSALVQIDCSMQLVFGADTTSSSSVNASKWRPGPFNKQQLLEEVLVTGLSALDCLAHPDSSEDQGPAIFVLRAQGVALARSLSDNRLLAAVQLLTQSAL